MIKDIIYKDLSEYDTEEEKISYLKDVVNHGCESGIVRGLVSYEDTTRFFDENESEIDEIINQYAEDEGIGYLDFIKSLRGSEQVEDTTNLKNLLSWFAYEEIARQILRDDFKIEDY